MPMPKINMQWLIPLATGVWAVWTWAAGQERDRNKERARMAALYVTPFLSACEDLQSRIYSILELDGLRTLRKRYPDGSYAEETLYLMKETLEALRSADDAQALPGRDRLMAVQNHLVELLVYVEKKEGYTLFHGERRKCATPTVSRTAAVGRPLSASALPT